MRGPTGRCRTDRRKLQSVLEHQLTENKIAIPNDRDGWEASNARERTILFCPFQIEAEERDPWSFDRQGARGGVGTA